MYRTYLKELLQQDFDRTVEENVPDKVKEMLENMIDRYKHLSAREVETVLSKTLGDVGVRTNIESVRLLLEYGADVNYEHALKQSALCRAVFSENEGMVRFLIDRGADINHKGINGETDFMFLMNKTNELDLKFLMTLVDSVSDLHERDARTGGTYLHVLAERHNDRHRVAMLEKLIQKGIPVNSGDNNDDTPLHRMAEVACWKSMKILLQNGADIAATNRLGESVLHTLASSNEFEGFDESLSFLLDQGLDINSLDSKRRTAVHHALLSKDTKPKAIKKLLSYGLPLNATDLHGRNEVFYAVENYNIEYTNANMEDRVEIIKLLVENGADVNAGDCYGITPLHLATTRDCLEILVTLLDLGADVTMQTRTGATPLHWACKLYNIAHVIIFWYLQNEHDLNIQDNYGSTALHWAVWYRQLSVCQSLLQTGSDATIQDKAGASPADLARCLFFNDFQTMLETYKVLEPQTLKEPVLECRSDQLFACPLLRYIRKSNGELDLDQYEKHVKFHKTSIQECVMSVLTVRNMGFFFDIEENQTVPAVIESLMRTLAKNVSDTNPLFRCELSLAGSSYEGTKVNIPDEFDYLWNMVEFSKAFIPIESRTFPDGFVKLRLCDEQLRPRVAQYLNEDDFLDCKILLRHLYKLINEELRLLLEQSTDSRFEYIACLGYLNEISGSLASLKLNFFGMHAKSFSISVDVVPSVFPINWQPTEFYPESSMALERTKGNLVFSVVFKTPDRCHVENFTLFYRVSFAYLEQMIIKQVPASIKKGYIVLKTLVECGYLPAVVDHDHEKNVKIFITTYHFKTCFLHELMIQAEEIYGKSSEESETVDFEESLKWTRLIVDRLDACVQKRFLSAFFNRNKNLFSIAMLRDGMAENETFVQLVKLLKVILEQIDIGITAK